MMGGGSAVNCGWKVVFALLRKHEVVVGEFTVASLGSDFGEGEPTMAI